MKVMASLGQSEQVAVGPAYPVANNGSVGEKFPALVGCDYGKALCKMDCRPQGYNQVTVPVFWRDIQHQGLWALALGPEHLFTSSSREAV